MIIKYNKIIVIIISLVIIIGCNDKNVINENDSLSCNYTDITGTCCELNEVDCNSICFGLSECTGCTDSLAINFDSEALIDDNNCIYDSFADSTIWDLVWNDEFNQSTIDISKWNHEIWGPGMVNNELQAYTNSVHNSYINDGNLIIKALNENYGNANYTSARLTSSGKGDFLYGRIDIKAILPSGEGTWPAIWMLPTDWVYGSWPSSGEIDIIEHVGCNLNVVKGSVHTAECNWNNNCPNQLAGGNGQDQYIPNVTNSYNIYSIEWSSSKIDFFINNNHYWTYSNIGQGPGMWPFDQKFHIILNLAIGGSWGGICPIDNSSFPQEMKIDFVRVYQKK